MAPKVKVLAAKGGDLNSVPETHMVEETNSCKFLSDTCTLWHMHPHTCVHIGTHTFT